MTREELKKQTIIILNREDITIEEMTENILQLVDVAISKELRLYGAVKSFVCGECGHDKKAVNTTLEKICCARCRSFVAN